MAKELHVVILPWSAFGHIIPLIQLSIALAKAQIHVSFISTPKNIQRLPKIPPELQSLITIVPFPLPTLDAADRLLPEGAEATVDIPFEKMDDLKFAFDLLRQPFKQFIADQVPDWIITDFAAHWAVDVAREYGVPVAYFSPFSAATHVFCGSLEYRSHVPPSPEVFTSPPEWVPFPSLLALKEFEAVHFLAGFFNVNRSGISDAERVAKIVLASQVLAFRSCNEIEGEYLDLYAKLTGKPVIPTGLLPPKESKRESGNDVIFEWLDKQKPRSVVFVGFGSECKVSKEQVYEIAHSELPFLWALRKPSWASTDAEALPLGFVDRTSKKGLVCMGWVPQIEILGHPSVGGSLFHSGWGSVIETLQFGHCFVVLPLIVDQPLNARLLVEKGLAAEVKRNNDGSFTADDIAKTLRLAMVEEEGEHLRINARKAAAVFGDEKLHQDHYLGAFVDYLKNNGRKGLLDKNDR
ncbi:putative soyasaponin III rhamnosyltransferase [Rosa chinensis]|uniref:Putative soyasaponin III rhamnosyltransferase n=1 Tax=Rosa chinensis TaxID=74649 RepID=A0A2P6SHT1_ROSCH|nr:putative UDP-rhamnose:rhamnosyltransferase 1 [Rosa chinensis]PRQ58237.1 putative soyasaponin III rhamnosyltransferase [Rosa chinensis]